MDDLPQARDPVRFRAALLAWYDTRARDLPWRGETDPYRIWVSEVMLQQTRVETVIPYYARWMERFPRLEELARADPESVLSAWTGLGYYARARNLHRAAQLVRERHGGELPRDPDALRALPGMGEYTVGAVASIAFGAVLPAIDGNVRRVLARLTDTPDPSPSKLRRWAAGLVDPQRPGDFNQALMELGATVCGPRNPDCSGCPVSWACAALAAGTQGDRPAPRRRPPVREVAFGVAVLVAEAGGGGAGGDQVLVCRRPPKGLLAGMWELPAEELEGGIPAGDVPEAARVAALGAAARYGIRPKGPGTALPPLDHLFSHLRATYHPVVWRVDRPSRTLDGALWLDPADSDRPPLAVAQGRILEEAMRLVSSS